MPNTAKSAAPRSTKPRIAAKSTKPTPTRKRAPRARKPRPIETAAEVSEILAPLSKPIENIATILSAPDVQKPVKPSRRFIAPALAALTLVALVALTNCVGYSQAANLINAHTVATYR